MTLVLAVVILVITVERVSVDKVTTCVSVNQDILRCVVNQVKFDRQVGF